LPTTEFRGYRRNKIEGCYISPANPDARKYLENFVREIVTRYPVDGIHLDYIRYPMSKVDYSDAARRGFHGTYGIDPLKLVKEPNSVRQKFGEQRYGELLDAWQAVRAGYVSGLVARIRTVIDEQRPGTMLSAAVKPDAVSALSSFGQDWPAWVREGYVQMVLPMAYGTNAGRVYEQIEEACREVGAEHVWAGLRAWEVPVSSVIERVKRVTVLAPAGICYFSYDGSRTTAAFSTRCAA